MAMKLKGQNKNKKQVITDDDAFLQAAQESTTWVKEHKVSVIKLSLAGVIAISMIIGTMEMGRVQRQDGAQLLQAALLVYDAEVVVEDDEIKADDTATPPTFASEEAKRKAALLAFQDVAAANASGVSTLGRFYIADLTAQAGDTVAAQSLFDTLVSSLSSSDNLFFLAVERAAYLHEQSGDHAGAIALLKRLRGGSNGGFYGDVAGLHMARNYTATEETERAKNLLQSTKLDYPNSTVMQQINEQLGQLNQLNQRPLGDSVKAVVEPSAAATK